MKLLSHAGQREPNHYSALNVTLRHLSNRLLKYLGKGNVEQFSTLNNMCYAW